MRRFLAHTVGHPEAMRADRASQDPADPLLADLRAADAEYHRLCIDIQEPDLRRSDLRLDELAAAVAALAAAVERLRRD